MKSFDCLSKEQKIFSPYFLEASAGTGKTFAIEHIFVRLLLENSKEILCENILVVTFTNAATRELKSRIHSSLETALSQLISNRISLPYLMGHTEEVRLCYIKKLEKALLHFDRAQIFTIHGFCFHALKTKGFDALVNIDIGDVGEISYKEELKQTLIDSLFVDVNQSAFGSSEIRHLLKSCKGDIHHLISKVLKILESELDVDTVDGFYDIFNSFNQKLQEIKSKNLIEDIESKFLEMASMYKGFCAVSKEVHPEYIEQVRLFERMYKENISYELFDQLVYSDSFFLEKFSEENKKKKTVCEKDLLKVEEFFYDMYSALVPLYHRVKNPSRILLRIAKVCKERIEKKYDRGKVFSFDAYLRLMLSALQNHSFKKQITSLYKAAIIDEFQDTDPIQWKIFKTLFMQEGFPLYLVGDPKQSIYAFRNADLPTFIEASSCFPKEGKGSLDTNFRSEPALVCALNELFSKNSAKNWLSSTGAIEYTEVKPSHFFEDTVFKDTGKHVHISIFEEEKSKEKSFPSKELEEEKIFPYIASEILKIKTINGEKFKDIAVLVRDRFQAQRIQKALSCYNIPLQIKSHTPLCRTKAFAFFKTLLIWLDTSYDKNLLKMVLAHPFMRNSHRDLKLEEESLSALDMICKLKDLSELYEEQGFLVFFKAFLQTKFFSNKDLEESLLEGGEAGDYQDLMQIFEVMLLHVDPPYFLQDILCFLEECCKKIDEEDASFMQKSFPQEDSVIIMTTHLSKGLEFPYVFALGVSSRNIKEESLIRMRDVLEIFDESNEEHQKYLQNINEEKMRQLYVAFTRAKKRIYLLFCLDKEEDGCCVYRSAMEELCLALSGSYQKKDLLKKIRSLNNLSLKLEEEEEKREVPSYVLKKEAPILPSPKEYHKIVKEKIFGSYSAFVKSNAHPYLLEKQEENTKNIYSLPSSKETGNLLHAILEKIFERGLYLETSNRAIKALIEQEIQGSHLIDWAEVIYTVVENVLALQFKVGEESFYIRDLKLKEVITEMPFFLYQDKRHVIKGFLDLFIINKGKIYLVDWKSNFLGNDISDYREENLRESMKHHDYFLQAQFYSSAVRSFISQNQKSLEYGGMFYVFLRGLEKETSKGVYFVP